MTTFIQIPELNLEHLDRPHLAKENANAATGFIAGLAILMTSITALYQGVDKDYLFSGLISFPVSIVVLFCCGMIMLGGGILVSDNLKPAIQDLKSNGQLLTDSECDEFFALMGIGAHIKNKLIAAQMQEYAIAIRDRDHHPLLMDLKQLRTYLKTHMSESDWVSAAPYLVTINEAYLKHI